MVAFLLGCASETRVARCATDCAARCVACCVARCVARSVAGLPAAMVHANHVVASRIRLSSVVETGCEAAGYFGGHGIGCVTGNEPTFQTSGMRFEVGGCMTAVFAGDVAAEVTANGVSA